MRALKDVLILQTAFLGDVILTLPLVEKIKSLHPGVQITFVARTGLRDFLLSLGIIDEVLEVTKGHAQSYFQARQTVAAKTFDLLLCPHPSFRSAMWARKILAREKRGAALWSFLYSGQMVRSKRAHQAERTGDLYLPSQPIKKNDEIFRFRFPPEPSAQTKKYVIFAGSQWETKRWPVHRHRALLKTLLDRGFQVDYLGSPEEKLFTAEIVRGTRAQNLCGQFSLLETVQHISSAELCISNDSGGAHLASLTQTPIRSLFGPTVPEQGFTPWCERSGVVQLENLNCRPCGAHGPRRCPLGHHACMEDLTIHMK